MHVWKGQSGLGYNTGTPAGESDIHHTHTRTYCTHSDTTPAGTGYHHGDLSNTTVYRHCGTPLHQNPIPWGTPMVLHVWHASGSHLAPPWLTFSTPHYPPEVPAAQQWAIAHHLTHRGCIEGSGGVRKGTWDCSHQWWGVGGSCCCHCDSNVSDTESNSHWVTQSQTQIAGARCWTSKCMWCGRCAATAIPSSLLLLLPVPTPWAVAHGDGWGCCCCTVACGGCQCGFVVILALHHYL